MQKILVICGPTATGKTALALKLAHTFSGEIISADSRQVYRGMDIGTGKDIPRNIRYQISDIRYQGKRLPFYGGNGTKIWGYDLVRPDQEFSVSQFVRTSSKIIKDMSKRKKLPILVGGTGLYINSLIEAPETIAIPPNHKIRHKLDKKTVSELQSVLRKLDKTRFNKLNHSDQSNPRRLIRSIEVVQYLKTHKIPKKIVSDYDPMWIGLTTPKKVINDRIEKRVLIRAKQGMNLEVKRLVKKYPNWQRLPAFSATGYRLWQEYLQKKLTKRELLHKWSTLERQYVRRQLTWFKKNKHINWFDVTTKNYEKQVEVTVKNWYAM